MEIGIIPLPQEERTQEPVVTRVWTTERWWAHLTVLKYTNYPEANFTFFMHTHVWYPAVLIVAQIGKKMQLDLWEGMGLPFKDLLIKRENHRFPTNAIFFYYQEWKVYLLFFALFVAATSAAPACKCQDEDKVKIKILVSVIIYQSAALQSFIVYF